MVGIQWRRLDLPPGFLVEHLSDSSPGRVVVSGSLDGVAKAAHLTGEGELTDIAIPPEAAALGSARVVRSCNLGVMGVCGAVGLWGRDVDTWNGIDTELAAYQVPRDERGTEAVWVWVTAGDDQLLATAAYPTEDGHELRVLDLFTRRLLPVEQRAVTQARLEDLYVAAYAGRVTVAEPATHRAWWSGCALLDPAEYREDPVPWLSISFEEPPVMITDSIDSDVIAFFAGVDDDGRVALWDSEGGKRETTDLVADPADPVALLAELEGWGGSSWDEPWREPDGLAAFVVRTAEGNRLSFLGDTYHVPDGQIRAAVLNRGFDLFRCFVLLDDSVHVGVIDE
jgi:hypothetical protein